MAQLDAKIAEAEEEMRKASTSGEKRKAKERKEDLMRLKRVEMIYVRIWVAFSIHAQFAEFMHARALCYLSCQDGCSSC